MADQVSAAHKHLESLRIQLDIILTMLQALVDAPQNFVLRPEGQAYLQFLNKRRQYLTKEIASVKEIANVG